MKRQTKKLNSELSRPFYGRGVIYYIYNKKFILERGIKNEKNFHKKTALSASDADNSCVYIYVLLLHGIRRWTN